MLEKLRQRSSEEAGFTLVELLVVMLILGILAAIAIPTFFNQRDKARDASVKEMVRTAQTAMETLAIDNNGSYSTATPAVLKAIEPTIDTAIITTAGPGTAPVAYTIVGTSSTGNKFTLTKNTNGSTSFSCTTTGSGGCPTGGNWAS
jgi:type IV pilus assembly protein PilA